MTQGFGEIDPGVDAPPLPELRYPARPELAVQFLDVLSGVPGSGQWSFQSFDDVELFDEVKQKWTGRKLPELAKLAHGAISGAAYLLQDLNNRGAGVFVTVNETDLRGRSSRNIQAVRALFIDKDDGPMDESRVTIPPSMRVRTPGGEHAYWLLAPGEHLDDWKPAQQVLIQHFQSDPPIHDLPRVLRLPGFWHCKRTPTLIDQVWYGDTTRRFTIAEVMRAYPRVRLVGGTKTSRPLSAASSAPTIEVGGRNVYLTSVGGSLRTRGVEHDAILIALRAENAALAEPLEEREVETIARSVARYEPTIDPTLNGALVDAMRASKAAAGTPGAILPPPPSWLQLLLVDQKGQPRSCASNATLILDNHPAWEAKIGVNVRAQEIVFLRPPPIEVIKGPFPRAFRDEDYTDVGVWLTTAQRLGDVNVRAAALAVASRRQFDPVVDYLDTQEWDGVRRLPNLMADYCGAHDAPPEYLAMVSVKWMIQCVARAMMPGCQADATLILEGKQGRGKTSFFRILAGQWLGEHPPREMGQKMQEFIRGVWIVEFGELSSFKKSEIEEVKSFLTLKVDRYRPAYGHTLGEWPRRCSFGGSTNGDLYLVDAENRRFWPVNTGRFDLEALARDRDQLWAEAVHYYDEGIPWQLTLQREIDLFSYQQAGRVLDDAIIDEIGAALEKGVRRDALAFPGMGNGPAWGIEPNAATVSVLEIAKHVFLSREHDPRLQARIITALRRLGWTRDRGTGRWVRGAK